MARGGYQRPTNPAPASGPGKLSRRTDGGQPTRTLSEPAYGEQQAFQNAQQAAPMASAASQPNAGQGGPVSPADLSSVVPFGEGTQRPQEPVTSGAATGPGPGMDALGASSPNFDPMAQYMTDALPMLEVASTLPFANTEFRQFVRRLRGMS